MYKFETEKKKFFPTKESEENVLELIKMRDRLKKILKVSGAVTMACAISKCGISDMWDAMVCVDWLVSIGELKEVTNKNKVAGQDRIFIPVHLKS